MGIDDDIAFQRGRVSNAPSNGELRLSVPMQLLEMLDALAVAKGLQSRGEVVTPILQRYVDEELHKATLLLRMARINPLLSEASGRDSD